MQLLASSDLSSLALPVAGIVLLFLIVFLSGFKKPYPPEEEKKPEPKKKKRFSWTDDE